MVPTPRRFSRKFTTKDLHSHLYKTKEGQHYHYNHCLGTSLFYNNYIQWNLPCVVIMNAGSTAYYCRMTWQSADCAACYYQMTWQSADCSIRLTCNKEGYFGNTALAIPQRILEWTSLGWKRFTDP